MNTSIEKKIDVELWYDKPFQCVSFWCDASECDFVYDIYRSIDYRYNKEGIK